MEPDLLIREKKYTRYLCHAFFVAITAIALFVRWKYILNDRMWPDESLYAWYAQRIYEAPSIIFSKEIIEFHPPLYACLLSLGHFFLSPELACKVVSLILNIIGIIAIYFLGLKIKDCFLGLFCCIMLAFNHLYISQSVHILIDGPIAVFCIFLILLMAHQDVPGMRRQGIYIGLMGVAIVSLKWPGIIVIIPFLIIYYYWAFPHVSVSKRFQNALIPLSLISFVTLVMVIYFSFLTGKIWPDLTGLKGSYFQRPFWYYAFNFHNILMIPYIIPCFLFGVFVLAKRNKRNDKLLLLWFLIFFAAISVSKEKPLRYSLLILPSSLLIAGIGFEEGLKKIARTSNQVFIAKMICIVCMLLFFWHTYPRTDKLMKKSNQAFTGFREAGTWIKNQANAQTIVMAGSRRSIRYYSGINFQEFEGNLLPLPPNRYDFEHFIANTKYPLLLEIDVWERAQPGWIFPPSPQHIEYLNGQGLQLEKTVSRNVGGRERDVIWIFSRGKIK